MRIQGDCRALSSGAPTLPCGELLPSAACFIVNQLLSADISFPAGPGIYQLALYQLEILLYRGHHSENNLRLGLGMFLWFGDLRARNLFYANPDTLQGDQRRWGI